MTNTLTKQELEEMKIKKETLEKKRQRLLDFDGSISDYRSVSQEILELDEKIKNAKVVTV